MRKYLIISLFVPVIGFGQFFESGEQNEEATSNSFGQSNNLEANGDIDPNPGGDDPDPAPIDDYLFLLPLLGMMVGSYYLLKNRSKYPS